MDDVGGEGADADGAESREELVIAAVVLGAVLDVAAPHPAMLDAMIATAIVRLGLAMWLLLAK